MTCTVQADGAIELFFYGELPRAEREAVRSHLLECEECRAVLEDLRVIRSALAARPDVAAPPGADWTGFMTRLGYAVRSEPRDSPIAASVPTRGTRVRSLVPYLVAAALLAIVTASVLFVAGTRSTTSGSSPPLEPESVAARPAVAEYLARPAADPALVSLSGEHFQRSKLVVLGLATKDSTTRRESDWTYERDLATTLLDDTRLYRQAAEERGMSTLAGVMRDLELVLLETSMSESGDPESLEQLQRLIRRRDLITKMNVVHTGG